MNVPDSFPDGDPFEAFAAEQEAVEVGESVQLAGLLETLHLLHDAAHEQDESSQDIRQRLGDLAVSMGRTRNTWLDTNPVIAPCLYDEMQWTPKQNTLTSLSFEKVMVRFPQLQGEEFSMFDPKQTLEPQDMFVEIIFKNSDSHRYLVNGNGIFAYPDAEALEFDDSAMFDIENAQDRPSVFKVTVDHWYVPPMTPVLLEQILLHESTFGPYQKP